MFEILLLQVCQTYKGPQARLITGVQSWLFMLSADYALRVAYTSASMDN